jgi:hypothetical protein
MATNQSNPHIFMEKFALKPRIDTLGINRTYDATPSKPHILFHG